MTTHEINLRVQAMLEIGNGTLVPEDVVTFVKEFRPDSKYRLKIAILHTSNACDKRLFVIQKRKRLLGITIGWKSEYSAYGTGIKPVFTMLKAYNSSI